MGRCPGCGEWNTLVEEAGRRQPAAAVRRGTAARVGPPVGGRPRKPVALAEVEAVAVERLSTGSDELDRVLGGGIVPGSIVLIGGSPGHRQEHADELDARARSSAPAGSTLYVSGEESAAQVRLRAERLGAARAVRAACWPRRRSRRCWRRSKPSARRSA